jgi:hypothetical protein
MDTLEVCDKVVFRSDLAAAEEEIRDLWDDVNALSAELRGLREELAEKGAVAK